MPSPRSPCSSGSCRRPERPWKGPVPAGVDVAAAIPTAHRSDGRRVVSVVARLGDAHIPSPAELLPTRLALTLRDPSDYVDITASRPKPQELRGRTWAGDRGAGAAPPVSASGGSEPGAYALAL